MGTARKDSLQKLLVRTTGKDSTRGLLARTHRYPETKLTQAKNQKVSIRKGGAFSNTYGYVKSEEQQKSWGSPSYLGYIGPERSKLGPILQSHLVNLRKPYCIKFLVSQWLCISK